MDAETKAYLDRMMERIAGHFEVLAAHLDAHDRRFDALEQRLDALEGRVGRLEISVAERFQSVDEQLRALQGRADNLETVLKMELVQVEYRIVEFRAEADERFVRLEKGMQALALDELRERVSLVVEHLNHLGGGVFGRLDAVEKQLLALTGQVNGLADDMRQRFRVVNDRLGEIDRRLAA